MIDKIIKVQAGERTHKDAWFKGCVTLQAGYYGIMDEDKPEWVVEWIRDIEGKPIYLDKTKGYQLKKAILSYGYDRFNTKIRKLMNLPKDSGFSIRLEAQETEKSWKIIEYDFEKFKFYIPKIIKK